MSAAYAQPSHVTALAELLSRPDFPKIHEEVIFATPHGSNLYGLQTDSSDEDWFVVTSSSRPRARHTVSGNFDVVQVGLKAFLALTNSGSHQSVEAAFSTRKLWSHPAYQATIESLKLNDHAVFTKYRRTIKAFSFGDFKRRRHAVRLAGNLSDLRRYGRFNPELNLRDSAFAGVLAENLAGHALAGILLSEF